jgi:hypothetical protein
MVNLYSFYFYKLIKKLTAFLRFQEFSFRKLPEASSTTFTVFSSQVKSKVGKILTKVAALRITLNIDDDCRF